MNNKSSNMMEISMNNFTGTLTIQFAPSNDSILSKPRFAAVAVRQAVSLSDEDLSVDTFDDGESSIVTQPTNHSSRDIC